MKNVKSLVYLLLMSGLFWQCTDDPDEVTSSNVSGEAVKGTVVNAEVNVYKYDGTRGELLATTTTNENGSFSVEGASATASSPEIKYGGIQAGLSQLIESDGGSPEELLVLVKAIADDFKDGVIDGKDGNGALEFSSRMTPEEAAFGLETAIKNFLNSENNNSGKSSNDFYGG